MKEIMRKTIAFLVAILALTATSTVSFAAPDADFDGSGQTPVWRYDAVNVTAYGYDAFGMLTKELYPGDTKSINVALRNNTSDEVMFRLVAEPVTKDQAKGLEPYFQASSTYNPTTSDKIANDSLLGLITLQVNQGASILYSGPLSGAGGSGSLYNKTNNILTDGASIGRVSPGWQGTVSVQITVPTTVPSEYMSKMCAVKWYFTAVQYNDPSQPPVTPPVNPPVDPPANPPVPSGGRTAANTGGSPDETSTVIDEPPLIDDMTSVDISEQALPESSGGGTAPDVTIDADPRPGDLGGQSWALLNLILTVTAGSLLVVSIVGVVTARNRSSHSDMDAMDLPLSDHNGSSNGFDMQGVGFGSAHPADGFGTDGEYVDRADRHMFRKNIAVIAGLIGLLSAVILFVLTENMKRPMIIVNRYTIIYLVIVIAEIAFIALSRRRSPKAYR